MIYDRRFINFLENTYNHIPLYIYIKKLENPNNIK